jgi:hypothetical protein
MWLAKIIPKAGNKKAWCMVKKDLKRTGITNENKDGSADYHAIGPSTYITGLPTTEPVSWTQ